MSSASAEHKPTLTSRFLIVIGLLSICAALGIFLLTFFPVIREELTYYLHIFDQKVVKTSPNQMIPEGAQVMEPVNKEFSILIPKINANAPVIAHVDPYNPRIYQYKLREGVAHAKGSALPGKGGNSFLFAHSAGNFYDASRYNAVFYLLTKLEAGDEVNIFYKGERIRYAVTSKRLVDPGSVHYLARTKEETLTLMTCWPPGTTLKRLIVQGKVKHESDK
jgi:sortase A